MADLATTDDVEAVWRPLTPAELEAAATLLGFASAVVRQRIPDVDARIASGALASDIATMVTAEMVKRRLENPSGYRSEQIGPFGFTRDSVHSAGGLYLTDDEVRLLSGRRRAFSITPHRPSPTAADLDRVAEHRAGRGHL